MLLSYVWIIMVILSIFCSILTGRTAQTGMRRAPHRVRPGRRCRPRSWYESSPRPPRRSGRRHAGAVSVRLSLPLERLCEADRKKRTCPEVLRAAPSPAFEALSGGLQRPFGPPGSLRKLNGKFSRTWQCGDADGHFRRPADACAFRKAGRKRRDVPSDRAEHRLHSAHSIHRRCRPRFAWVGPPI